jgi:hypothetical protein
VPVCRHPPINFHSLRHTAATLALEDGISPHVVAAMLGHASVTTTLGLYAHVTKGSMDALARVIDSRYPVSAGSHPRAASKHEGRNEGTKEGKRPESAYSARENGVPGKGIEFDLACEVL